MADPFGHLNLNVAENHSSYDGLRLLHALLYINKSLCVTKYNKLIPVGLINHTYINHTRTDAFKRQARVFNVLKSSLLCYACLPNRQFPLPSLSRSGFGACAQEPEPQNSGVPVIYFPNLRSSSVLYYYVVEPDTIPNPVAFHPHNSFTTKTTIKFS